MSATRTFDAQGNRTDAHRPQVFDPQNYEVIGYADLKPVSPAEYGFEFAGLSAEAHQNAMELLQAAEEARQQDCERLFGTRHPSPVCGHCGYNPLRWVAAARHIPTGEVIVVGEICDQNRLSLPNREAFSSAYIRSHANNLKRHLENLAAVARARTAFVAEEPEVAAFVENLPEGESFGFLVDMARSMAKWGRLTPAQTAATKRIMAKRVEQAAAKANEVQPTTPLVEGRRVIEGTVVSTKWVSSDYGDTLKMLVRQDDGNKVWGTCPSKLDVERGDRVRLTAKVERSRDDENFGFYSRPAKAEVLTQKGEQA